MPQNRLGKGEALFGGFHVNVSLHRRDPLSSNSELWRESNRRLLCFPTKFWMIDFGKRSRRYTEKSIPRPKTTKTPKNSANKVYSLGCPLALWREDSLHLGEFASKSWEEREGTTKTSKIDRYEGKVIVGLCVFLHKKTQKSRKIGL